MATKTQSLTLRLDPGNAERLDALAGEADVSRSEVVRGLIQGTQPLPAQTGLAKAADSPYRELGTSGLQRFGGSLREEKLRELRGAAGRAMYREMRQNDAVISAVFFAIEMALRQVRWFAESASDKSEDRQAAEFLEQCLHDQSFTWDDTLQFILTMLEQGFSLLELVYKKRQGAQPRKSRGVSDPARSQYSDGRIGWRKWAPRPAESLVSGNEWIFDGHGGVQGINQQAPPKYTLVPIPIERLLLFRTTPAPANSPEGQALPVDTSIPTPDGWTAINELQVGDKIFGGDGKIRYVVAKSQVWGSRPVFKVKFSAGHEIIADANHLWSITTANDRSKNRPSRMLTTEEMYSWLSKKIHGPFFSAGIAPVLDASEVSLPLDPYVLGYWLGDGNSKNGVIAVAPDDFQSLAVQLESAGFPTSYDGTIRAYTRGLKILLRAIGVLDNKHIPQSYLRASSSQRLALLQGLMDSDGSERMGIRDHAAKFYNTNERLVGQFCELVRSLGGQPRLYIVSKPGDSGGSINGHSIICRKTCYAVSFYLDRPVHRLARKAAQQSLKSSHRRRGHLIESIEPAGQTATVCIQVDDPKNLFLAGKGCVPTHNSVLRSMYEAYYYVSNIQEIEGIGLERDLAGLPIIYLGKGCSLTGANSDYELAKDLVRNIRRDEQEGIVIPKPKLGMGESGEGMLLELLSSSGGRQFDTGEIINRWDQRKAMALLAQFIMLGMERVGSYALSRHQGDFFNLAVSAWADGIAQTVNRHAVFRLFRANTFRLTELPRLSHSAVGVPDLEELARYVNALVGAEVLTPDEELERYLREAAQFPERQEREPTLEKVGKRVDGPDPDAERLKYRKKLQRKYSGWLSGMAGDLVGDDPPEDKRKKLAAALAVLALLLKRTGREELPKALGIGRKGEAPSPAGLADLAAQIARNEEFLGDAPGESELERMADGPERMVGDTFVVAAGRKLVLASGEPGVDTLGVISSGETLRSRLGLYDGGFWLLVLLGLKDWYGEHVAGEKVKWILDPAAAHCEDCPALAGVYENWDALPTLPGQGVRCDGNCRCRIFVQQGGQWTWL